MRSFYWTKIFKPCYSAAKESFINKLPASNAMDYALKAKTRI